MRSVSVVLLSTVALAAIAAPAAAQTTISSNTSTPIATATAASGAPSDVTIASGATVNPASGTAVTINSSNSVTNNGTLTFNGVDNATGIGAATGLAGTVTNAGTITVSETSTAVDENKDGNVDGPFATGVNRFGIHVSGGGTFTGAVTSTGTITIVGNTSAGIAVDGTLAGSLSSTGTLSVMGANSYGIRTGAVTGNVTRGGTLTATGQGAVGIALDGDIGGAVSIGGTTTVTGFRGGATAYATPIADDLYLGGPAVQIAGNVAGGVTVASNGTVTSDGSAPALLIGAASNAVTLSPVSGGAYGLVIAGTVNGAGVNTAIDGNAVVLGGRGGAVTIGGGVSVTGAITASANLSNATALNIGAGATVPTLAVTGSVTATGGAGAYTGTAVLVNPGASLPSLTNSGTISATIAGGTGAATAIRDLSGTLTSITNTGIITASGATVGSGTNVALDLSAGTGGVTITQSGAAARISGDVVLTNGADTLAVSSGLVSGNVSFGDGADTLALSGGAVFDGNVVFGAGAKTLTLADTASFTGAFTNAGALAVSITGGTLRLTAPATIGSLAVGAGGKLGVYLDTTTLTAPSLTVVGNATFATGATITPEIATVLGAEGQHLAISAGQLQAGTLSLDSSTIPYLYTTTLATSGNTVLINIARKSAADLGLVGAQAVIYNPAYATLANAPDIANVFLAQTTAAGVQAALAELLPDQSDATFEMATLGSRAVERITADPQGLIHRQGDWGYWLAPLGWHSNARPGVTSGYDVTGYGIAGGVERDTKLGAFGLSLAYLDSHDTIPDTVSKLTSNQYQVAGTWRGTFDVLQLSASAGYARIGFGSERQFTGVYGVTTVDRAASANWHGDLTFASASASYEMGAKKLFLRPNVSIDYDRLGEDAHAETDTGGTGFALAINARTSSEAAATASLAGGIDLYGDPRDYFGRRLGEHVFRLEAEGGFRQVFSGALGDTTAQFAGGTPFTLDGFQRDSGWIGRLRAIGGTDHFRLGAEIGGEERAGHVETTARATLRIAVD